MAAISTLVVQLTTQTGGFRRGMSQSSGLVSSFSKTTASATAVLVKFTAAAAAAGATLGIISVRFFGRFEQSMSRVQAITNATGLEMKLLEDAARSLGRTTQFTASQVAEAQGEFALAGFKTNQILKSLEPTLKLAIAGNLGIAESADIAIRIMGGLGQTADDLEASLEILARGFTTSSTNIRELGEAFKFVAPLSKASGQSFTQLTAVLQAFAEGGIRGSLAGTSLRNVLLRLAIQPGNVKRQFDQLGVSIEDSAGNFRPLTDIVEDLNKALSLLTQVQRTAAIGQIAGARAVAGFTKLLDLGADRVRDLEAALKATGNVLDRVAKVQMNTLQGAVKRLTSAFEGFGIAIGSILNKFVRPLIEQAAKAFNILETFINRNSDLIIIMIRLTGEWVKEMSGAVTVIRALQSPLDTLGKLGSAVLQRLKNQTLGLASSFNTLGDASSMSLERVTTGSGKLESTLDSLGVTGPTVLDRLQTGLILLETVVRNGGLAFDLLGTLAKSAFADAGAAVKRFFTQILPTLAKNIAIISFNVTKAIAISFREGLKLIVPSFKAVFKLLVGLAFQSGKALREALLLGLTGTGGLKAITQVFNVRLDRFVKDAGKVIDDFKTDINSISKTVETAFSASTLLAGTKEIPAKILTELQETLNQRLIGLLFEFKQELRKTEIEFSIFDPAFDLPKFAKSVADATENGMNDGIARVGIDPRAASLAERGTVEAFRAERGITSSSVERNTAISAKENERQTALLDRIEDALAAAEETIDIL